MVTNLVEKKNEVMFEFQPILSKKKNNFFIFDSMKKYIKENDIQLTKENKKL